MSGPPPRGIAPARHDGVTCDNCNVFPLCGPRFRCINCLDFDLCALCEPLPVHDPTHTFLKINLPTPGTDFPFIPAPVGPGALARRVGIFGPRPSHLPAPPSSSPGTGANASAGVDPSLIRTINQLTFQLQHLSASKDKPTGICAINIYHALSMAAVGSRGPTLAAFASLMGFDSQNLDQLVARVLQLDTYIKSSPAIDLRTAASVWHAGLPLTASWKRVMEEDFKATFGPLDADTINAFASRATNGKIEKIVTKEGLANTVLLLVTALYFKATWADPFRAEHTHDASFHTFDGDTKRKCRMMHRTGQMQYAEGGAFRIVVLPYKDGGESGSGGPKWRAAVMLPREKGFAAMSQLLKLFASSTTALSNVLAPKTPHSGTLRSENVSLFLPRFTLKLSLKLNAALSTLGLTPAFSPSLDFAPLSDSGPLLIDAVTHDLFIEVNEQGTEMAGVTAVSFGRGAMPRTTEMRVDRPFLFVVYEEGSGVVLCSVVVQDVSKE